MRDINAFGTLGDIGKIPSRVHRDLHSTYKARNGNRLVPARDIIPLTSVYTTKKGESGALSEVTAAANVNNSASMRCFVGRLLVPSRRTPAPRWPAQRHLLQGDIQSLERTLRLMVEEKWHRRIAKYQMRICDSGSNNE